MASPVLLAPCCIDSPVLLADSPAFCRVSLVPSDCANDGSVNVAKVRTVTTIAAGTIRNSLLRININQQLFLLLFLPRILRLCLYQGLQSFYLMLLLLPLFYHLSLHLRRSQFLYPYRFPL